MLSDDLVVIHYCITRIRVYAELKSMSREIYTKNHIKCSNDYQFYVDMSKR